VALLDWSWQAAAAASQPLRRIHATKASRIQS
jgi:hypothetical protein